MNNTKIFYEVVGTDCDGNETKIIKNDFKSAFIEACTSSLKNLSLRKVFQDENKVKTLTYDCDSEEFVTLSCF